MKSAPRLRRRKRPKRRKRTKSLRKARIPTSSTEWAELFDQIRASVSSTPLPSVSAIAENSNAPFSILISTVISLRTKDEVTTAASERLFAFADDPRSLADTDQERIAAAIYPAGFYRTKAARLREIGRILVDQYDGAVPRTEEELLKLPGVGRKTANLVLGLGFGIPAICVDTHVHRIANRVGWISTQSPQESEKQLSEVLPRELWIEVNGLLVSFGQQICTPVSPWCSCCPLGSSCPRYGVTRSR